uniref:Uncharacterized protein n=1 Tax=Triticum urartu TaxID=4572 RepID=A0A8R7UL93_TRIUA
AASADQEEEEDAGLGGPGGGGGRGEGEEEDAGKGRRRTRAEADREEEEEAGLGAVPVVVAVLAKPGASPAALVHAVAAAGSFACGIEDGAWAVLAAGAVGHLTRLPAHPHGKIIYQQPGTTIQSSYHTFHL